MRYKQRYLAYNKGNDVRIPEHRAVFEAHYGAVPKDMVVDHIDRDITNNSIENLRLATIAQNGMNRGAQKNNKHKLKNVYQNATGKWYAQVTCKGVRYTSTVYNDVYAAVAAAETLRTNLHGEFACGS